MSQLKGINAVLNKDCLDFSGAYLNLYARETGDDGQYGWDSTIDEEEFVYNWKRDGMTPHQIGSLHAACKAWNRNDYKAMSEVLDGLDISAYVSNVTVDL